MSLGRLVTSFLALVLLLAPLRATWSIVVVDTRTGEVADLLGAGLRLSCQCSRVPVQDGHTLSVAVAFARPVAREALLAAWRGFPALDLPSAPDPVLVHREEEDRPQPRLDREAQGGMQVTLGRLRPCPVLEHRFVVLVHNLERGAAGAAVLNAEAVFAGA